MTIESVGVGRPAVRRRGRDERVVLRAWYAFASARTANVLLGLVIVAGILSILIGQFGTSTLADPNLYAAAVQRAADRYGQPLASIFVRLDLYRIFTSWWFTLLVGLFSASLLGNTLGRLPRVIRDIRTPPVRRARAFFRSSVPARTGPLEGLDGRALPELLQRSGYRVRTERAGDVTHLLAERHRLSPLASLVSHAALALFVLGMGIVTPRFGYETALKVPIGEGRPTGFPTDPQTVLVRNEAFLATFDPAGRPLEFRTTLSIYRQGRQIARKEITVNDPLSVDGWAFHENFFGPAVDLDVRDSQGQILYSGAVLLDGQLGGKPEGRLAVPGSDTSLELLLAKGAGGVAQLTVIGVRPPVIASDPPEIVFGAVLGTGGGYRVPDGTIGIEFTRPSSYIGVIAKRDPGQGMIWLGAVLLVAGVTISLLAPRRRVWARFDATTVRLAVVGGDPFAEEECARVVGSLPGRSEAASPARTASLGPADGPARPAGG
ncbi:MAG: cytochrome c biogenesis protein ResB [Chloroflexi bacterium]|nr:cytochrome c biogenesis protein ResB [Chloroflexota bacterium]